MTLDSHILIPVLVTSVGSFLLVIVALFMSGRPDVIRVNGRSLAVLGGALLGVVGVVVIFAAAIAAVAVIFAAASAVIAGLQAWHYRGRRSRLLPIFIALCVGFVIIAVLIGTHPDAWR
jgi:hypothetical protein